MIKHSPSADLSLVFHIKKIHKNAYKHFITPQQHARFPADKTLQPVTVT